MCWLRITGIKGASSGSSCSIFCWVTCYMKRREIRIVYCNAYEFREITSLCLSYARTENIPHFWSVKSTSYSHRFRECFKNTPVVIKRWRTRLSQRPRAKTGDEDKRKKSIIFRGGAKVGRTSEGHGISRRFDPTRDPPAAAQSGVRPVGQPSRRLIKSLRDGQLELRKRSRNELTIMWRNGGRMQAYKGLTTCVPHLSFRVDGWGSGKGQVT